ncbi:MAG: Abnormal spindle-like microcephaly-assocd, ASPM-SPD-2-Hydin [Actinomycetota bacterium]|nr:Abnormal spindle-like microcephaly-assocd, ASPM-SPD-2-Hydin [Actinomycetota bacterium]
MSDGKPFWSTVPGVVTGAAGVISAIVGLLGISVQLGWIGGDDKAAVSSSSGDAVVTTTLSTVRGATTTPSVSTAKPGEFSVDPQTVTFEPLKAKEATVIVKNTGDVPLTVRMPVISGTEAANFTIADETCTASTLERGRTCEIKVAFAATQPGHFEAKLAVAASGVPRQVEVSLKGDRGLLG